MRSVPQIAQCRWRGNARSRRNAWSEGLAAIIICYGNCQRVEGILIRRRCLLTMANGLGRSGSSWVICHRRKAGLLRRRRRRRRQGEAWSC